MKRTAVLRRWAMSVVGLLMLATSPLAAANLSNSLALTYDDGAGHAMPYRLFLPEGYNDPSADFPLVLFLHGGGESGTNNTTQVSVHIDGLINATRSGPFAAFLLAPQLPVSAGWGSYNPSDLSMEILDSVLAGYSVDARRLYITGFSMGGFGTYEYISEFPKKFAAAVPIAGGGDSSAANAQRIKDIPIFINHGGRDFLVPIEYSYQMVDALRAAGGSPLFAEYSDVGHSLAGIVYNDTGLDGLYGWMFAQSLPPAVPEPSSCVLAGIAGVALLAVGRQRKRREVVAQRQSTTV